MTSIVRGHLTGNNYTFLNIVECKYYVVINIII